MKAYFSNPCDDETETFESEWFYFVCGYLEDSEGIQIAVLSEGGARTANGVYSDVSFYQP